MRLFLLRAPHGARQVDDPMQFVAFIIDAQGISARDADHRSCMSFPQCPVPKFACHCSGFLFEPGIKGTLASL
jgi:hypothetical protein